MIKVKRLVMTKRISTLKVLMLALLTFLTSSCSVFSSSDEEEPAVELKMLLTASDNINPSEVSDGNPVVINLYQLKSVEAFKAAQVLDLYEKDISILADDLVKRQVLASVLPKEKRTLMLAVAPGTKYLAVFVQFSNYSQSKATAWLELNEPDDIERVDVSIDSLTVNIESVVEDSYWPW